MDISDTNKIIFYIITLYNYYYKIKKFINII